MSPATAIYSILIDKCNCNFGKWEQIKCLELTPDEYTIDSTHLIPTIKIKRTITMKIYSDLYDKIYK